VEELSLHLLPSSVISLYQLDEAVYVDVGVGKGLLIESVIASACWDLQQWLYWCWVGKGGLSRDWRLCYLLQTMRRVGCVGSPCIVCEIRHRFGDGREVGRGILPSHRQDQGEGNKLLFPLTLREEDAKLRDVRCGYPDAVESVRNIYLQEIHGPVPGMCPDDSVDEAM
jgi:hypothetical protein